MKALLSTLPGLENAVMLECLRRNISVISPHPWNLKGRLLVEGDVEELLSLRLIEHVVEVLDILEVKYLDTRNLRYALRASIKGLPLDIKSFYIKGRVYGRCFNEHLLETLASREFKRILKAVPSKSGVLIRCELFCEERVLLLGIQVNRIPLHIRSYYMFKHPSPLNPILAASVAYLLDIRRDMCILDPFLGAGTIPIELVSISQVYAIGMDIVDKYVNHALKNAVVAGVDDKCLFLVGNALTPPLKKESIDLIVTDPPRGLRLRTENIKRLYREFINSASKVLNSGGLLCVFTPYRSMLLECSRNTFSEKVFYEFVRGRSRVYLVILERK